MWTGFSAAASAALSGVHKVASLAQITSPGGVVLATLDVIGGDVAEDETARFRRTCSLKLATVSLVPRSVTDLLHPLSGNELRLWRGVQLLGATSPELAPLGVFRLAKPQISDGGSGLQIAVSGQDRSSAISRASWTAPYTTAGGQNVATAIQGIISNRWRGQALTYNLATTSIVVPAGRAYGVQFTSKGLVAASGSTTSGGNDPWADCQALALSAGMELFFDRQGVVVMRPIPQPNQQQIAMQFIEGPTCTMESVSRSLDESKFVNQVIVIGTGATVTKSDGSVGPGAAVRGVASSSDPNVGVTGPLGARPVFLTDQTIATATDATAAATAYLTKYLSTAEKTSINASCDPRVDAGDTIRLTRQRAGVSGVYVASATTCPLDPTSGMTVTNRATLVSL